MTIQLTKDSTVRKYNNAEGGTFDVAYVPHADMWVASLKDHKDDGAFSWNKNGKSYDRKGLDLISEYQEPQTVTVHEFWTVHNLGGESMYATNEKPKVDHELKKERVVIHHPARIYEIDGIHAREVFKNG